jgi:hypothetical protein
MSDGDEVCVIVGMFDGCVVGESVGDILIVGSLLGALLGCKMMGIPISIYPHEHLDGLPGYAAVKSQFRSSLPAEFWPAVLQP